MARDLEFLYILLNHTLKDADRSEGSSKLFMLDQADRLRAEIKVIEDAMPILVKRVPTKRPAKKKATKKTAKRKAK
jgi:hypothetical protein